PRDAGGLRCGPRPGARGRRPGPPERRSISMTRRSASRWFLCAVFGTALACGGDKDAATPAQPATKSAADDASAGGEEPSDPAAQLPEAAEILARAVDAVGGKAKLDAVHS